MSKRRSAVVAATSWIIAVRSARSALGKSLVELCERITRYSNKVSALSGIAAHFDEAIARENAKFELIERDAVLTHHFDRKPFERTEWQLVDLIGESANSLLERLQLRGYKLAFFRAESILSEFQTVVCQVSVGLEQCLFGFGCCENARSAATKALFECIQNVAAFDAGLLEPSDFAVEPTDKKWNAEDHGFLSLNSSYFREVLSPVFGSNTDYSVSSSSSVKPNFDFELLENPEFLEGCGLSTVVARSRDLQNLFFGLPSSENLNLKRLHRNSNLEENGHHPHFIG